MGYNVKMIIIAILLLSFFPSVTGDHSDDVYLNDIEDYPPDIQPSLGYGFRTITLGIRNYENVTVDVEYEIGIAPVFRAIPLFIRGNCSVSAESTERIVLPIGGFLFARVGIIIWSPLHPDSRRPWCTGIIVTGFVFSGAPTF